MEALDHEQLMFCTVCGDADLSNRGLNRQKFNTFTMFCCIFPEVTVDPKCLLAFISLTVYLFRAAKDSREML